MFNKNIGFILVNNYVNQIANGFGEAKGRLVNAANSWNSFQARNLLFQPCLLSNRIKTIKNTI